jgi:fumarate reductase iron-sulfur subunit
MADTIRLEVFRYRPEEESEPDFQAYDVPFKKEWVVLDALNYIKDEVDETLSFRWSCRMGVCGSCGMMVNGVPKLTCATFLTEYHPGQIRVEPLAGFPVERDLVSVIDDFMEKLTAVQPWLIRKNGDQEQLEKEYLQTPAELASYKQYSMCINCLLCYAACPVYHQDPSFIGPAAIALAQRYNLDSRDQGERQRSPVLVSHEGVWECTFIGECSTVCPKDVDPAGAIQRAKVAGTTAYFQDLLMPWGSKS